MVPGKPERKMLAVFRNVNGGHLDEMVRPLVVNLINKYLLLIWFLLPVVLKPWTTQNLVATIFLHVSCSWEKLKH